MGPKWVKMGSKWAKMWSQRVKMVILVKVGQNGSKWVKMESIWSQNRIKIGQSGPKCGQNMVKILTLF